MLVVDNGDAIRGIAEVVSKLDFTINGYVGTTATQLADGQISNAEGDLYLSSADATVVTSITVVNTDTSARTFTLYLKPSGGTSRAISPVSLDLPISYSFYTDGQRAVVMSTGGEVVQTYSLHAASHTDGTDDIQESSTAQKGICQLDDTPVDGEANEPITSNWAFDHAAGLDAHTKNIFEAIRTGEYFAPIPRWKETTTVALAANSIYIAPFIVARNLTIDRLAIQVTAAGAGGTIARLGIYADGTNLYPGDLVQDYGTVAVDAIATVAASADQALTRGLYWLAVVSDDTPTLVSHAPTWSPLGTRDAGFYLTWQYCGWTKGAVGSGALDDPCVGTATMFYNYAPLIVPRLKTLD